MWIAHVVLFTALGLLFAHMGYPIILVISVLLIRRSREANDRSDAHPLSLTMIIPVYAKDYHQLPAKLADLENINYSHTHLEILVTADGNLPQIPAIIENVQTAFPIRYIQTGNWVGKNKALNMAAESARGEVLVISDVDTRLASDSLMRTGKIFTNKQVGGACGTLVILDSPQARPGWGGLQKLYWKYEKWIKKLEAMTLGSVTASSGQLMAVRRYLYPKLPTDVNDDLYIALSVIEKGFRFTGATDAIAYITAPSKNISEEMTRRPRIVAGGLTAIWKHRRIFVQKNTFFYGLCLFLHKIARRLSPILLMIIFLATGILSFHSGAWFFIFITQILFYMICMLSFMDMLTGRFFSMLSYFFALNISTLIGIWEFLRAEGRSKW